jgi:hypothetical protein
VEAAVRIFGKGGSIPGYEVNTMLLRTSHPLVALMREAERNDRALARALDMVSETQCSISLTVVESAID